MPPYTVILSPEQWRSLKQEVENTLHFVASERDDLVAIVELPGNYKFVGMVDGVQVYVISDAFTPSIEEDETPFSELEELADNIDPQESAQHWRDRQSGDDSDDDYLNILDAEVEDDG